MLWARCYILENDYESGGNENCIMTRVNRHPYQLKINVLFHNNDTVIKMYLFKVPDYS